MGILREKEECEPIRIEEEAEAEHVIDYGDYIFDDDYEEEEAAKDKSPSPHRPRQNFRRKKCFEKQMRYIDDLSTAVDGLSLKKSMGAQKWRRVESARLIASFTDPDDICYDYSDLMEPTITAFTQILSDEKKMKIWNDFIEKDEEEQNRILEEIDLACRDGKSDLSGDGFCDVEKEFRAHHPAFSAKACFHRMDKKFKSHLLKKRSLPFDFIEQCEAELREFFSTTPTGVYVESLESRIKRFYLHALAQFLTLSSSSLADTKPNKVIQVCNDRGHFTPPDTSLVPFVMKMRKKSLVA